MNEQIIKWGFEVYFCQSCTFNFSGGWVVNRCYFVHLQHESPSEPPSESPNESSHMYLHMNSLHANLKVVARNNRPMENPPGPTSVPHLSFTDSWARRIRHSVMRCVCVSVCAWVCVHPEEMHRFRIYSIGSVVQLGFPFRKQIRSSECNKRDMKIVAPSVIAKACKHTDKNTYWERETIGKMNQLTVHSRWATSVSRLSSRLFVECYRSCWIFVIHTTESESYWPEDRIV